MEVNLDNPIFVYNINVDYLPKKDMIIQKLYDALTEYSNITFLIVPNTYTKVECVYSGRGSKKLLIDKLENIFNSVSIEDEKMLSKLREQIRNLIID